MTYTLDILDGKITLPKPWRNKRRVRVIEKKSQLIFEEDFDKTPEELKDENVEVLGDYEGVRFNKGVETEVLIEYTKNILKKKWLKRI